MMGAEVRPLLILGTHVFAEEVAELAEGSADLRLAGFVENWDRSRCGDEAFLGMPVHWIDDVAELSSDHVAVCAIGTTRRRGFIEQAQASGLGFAVLRHRAAIIPASATVGAGSVASAGVVIAAGARIGSHVIMNRGVLIGHHTTVGDYVTISPGANIAGCVTIGAGVYVGMGAIVLDRLSVGEGAVVGAGAVVTRDVAPGTRVMGIPARVVEKDIDGR